MHGTGLFHVMSDRGKYDFAPLVKCFVMTDSEALKIVSSSVDLLKKSLTSVLPSTLGNLNIS